MRPAELETTAAGVAWLTFAGLVMGLFLGVLFVAAVIETPETYHLEAINAATQN